MATASRSTGIAGNETVRLTVGLTSGTYTLSFGGQTTASINHNDTSSTLQTRLSNLSTIGSGNVVVTRRYDGATASPSNVHLIQFIGTLAGNNVGTITSSSGSNTLTVLNNGGSNAFFLIGNDPSFEYSGSFDPGTIVVMAYQNYARSSTARIDSAADSAGNVYNVSLISAGTASKGAFQLIWCRLQYPVTASTTVTFQTTGTQHGACVSQAFTGINGTYSAGRIDSALRPAAASSWTTTALSTLSKANGIVIGAVSFYADFTLGVNTAGASQTFLGYADGLTATACSVSLGYRNVSSTSNTSITLSSSGGTGSVSYQTAALHFYELPLITGNRTISVI
jgi:hypothetical protein